MSSNPQDLTPQARIRHAAVELFGGQGFDKTTIRQIASRAGVSPGLVIHHYGSKNGLRQACDDWVIGVIATEKQFLVGPIPQMSGYVAHHPELAGVMAYLVASLREGGEMARTIFVRLCDLTDELVATGEEHGLIRASENRGGVIALMVALSCGLMLFDREVAGRLGGASLTDPQVIEPYVQASLELFSHGLFTPEYAEALRAAVVPTSTEGKP